LIGMMAVNMAGNWPAAVNIEILRRVLVGTEFGHAWIWHLILVGLLVIATLASRPRALWIAVLATLATANLAQVGHAAMGEGLAGDLHRLNQAIHLLAAGAWVGGVATLSFSLFAARTRPADSLPVLRRFSGAGSIVVTLVLVTGTINGVLLVGSLPALFSTDYGKTLLIKFALVAAMIALATFNRVYLLPRHQTDLDGAARRLRRLAATEFVIGLSVILVACLLGSLDPPGA
jgi:putative copper resistance protein D